MKGCLRWTLMGIGGLVVVLVGLGVVAALVAPSTPAGTATPQAPAVSLAVASATTAPMATPEPAATDTPAVPPTDTPPPTATPEPLILSGTGQQATPAFNLASGLVHFEFSHTGERNFAVFLLDGQGNQLDLLVNVIGSTTGSKAVHVDGGPYVLDVSADGPWSVAIAQPAPPADAPMAPLRLEGTGQAASSFFVLPGGLTRFEFAHDGERNFAVFLLNAQGEPVEMLANEIGATTGSKASGLDAGVYLLDVSADGPWWVTVAQ